MATHHSNSGQPDLHQVIADALNEAREQGRDKPPEARLPEPVTLDQVSIPCQRMLNDVQTLNSKITRGDLAASVAVVTQNDDSYAFLFVTVRRAGEAHWQPVGSVGGTRRPEVEGFLGKLSGPRSFVCVGSMGVIPDGGSIRIELPDGNVHEDRSVDGCCIALAPVTYPPDIGEPLSVRYLNPDGSERGSETR